MFLLMSMVVEGVNKHGKDILNTWSDFSISLTHKVFGHCLTEKKTNFDTDNHIS